MTNQPKVTALINTFNHGTLLEEAIESVMTQDYAGPMEIVVVDDGSTDDTSMRVKKYGDRVRYVWKENGGQASAINAGFENSSGEVIAMLDGDDVWLPAKVRKMVDALAAHPDAGWTYHPYQIWDMELGSTLNDSNFYLPTGYLPDRLQDLIRTAGYGTCAMVVRREAAEKVLPIPSGLRILADAYFGAVMLFAAPVVGVPEHLTRYRHHGGNYTSYRGNDPQRAGLRAACAELAQRTTEEWLALHGFDRSQPATTAFLKRVDLTTRMVRFQSMGAGRVEFFRYLWDYQNLFGVTWTMSYRIFRKLMAFGGYALGFDTFVSLQNYYRASSMWKGLRGRFIPVMQTTSASQASRPT